MDKQKGQKKSACQTCRQQCFVRSDLSFHREMYLWRNDLQFFTGIEFLHELVRPLLKFFDFFGKCLAEIFGFGDVLAEVVESGDHGSLGFFGGVGFC